MGIGKERRRILSERFHFSSNSEKKVSRLKIKIKTLEILRNSCRVCRMVMLVIRSFFIKPNLYVLSALTKILGIDSGLMEELFFERLKTLL